MYLCERKKNFIKFPALIEVIKIDFWQIWYLDVNNTVCMGLQLSIILMQTVGRFDV